MKDQTVMEKVAWWRRIDPWLNKHPVWKYVLFPLMIVLIAVVVLLLKYGSQIVSQINKMPTQ